MVSDNRWVATTKGIVVFLLTALLFVFWYDRDRELAESHVTAVRFGFYRVIWIEVLCFYECAAYFFVDSLQKDNQLRKFL